MVNQDREIVLLRESLSRFNADVGHTTSVLAQTTRDAEAARRALESEKLRGTETLRIVESHDLAA